MPGCVQRGLCVEPRNADLKKNLKEIDELIRGEKVSQFISQAEAQLKAGDYGAAMRATDAGMRLDAGNSDLKAVLDRAKPKFDEAERSRRSGLSSTELLKEKGDDFYKKASFEVSSLGSYFDAVACGDKEQLSRASRWRRWWW